MAEIVISYSYQIALDILIKLETKNLIKKIGTKKA